MLEDIQKLPEICGVYQYFDQNSRLLYIGKAKNLRSRVKSYWRFTPFLHPNPTQNPRIIKMLSETTRLEYLVVDSEEDALILENSLIKQLRPKYNILMRDDKTYPYIYIDESQDFPRFELTRRIIRGDRIRYYGPFPNGGRALLDALYDIYPIVQKRSGLDGGKACLFHQIGRCLAPCEKKITPSAYHKIIAEAKQAIHNKKIILGKLKLQMETLAFQERYEEAAKIRDRITTLKSLKINSSIDMANHDDIDIFTVYKNIDQGVVVRLFIREGRIISSSHSFFRESGIFDADKAYRQILLDFYTSESPSIPRTILVAEQFDSISEISQILRKRLGRYVKLKYPQRGDKRKLVELSLRNARELLKKRSQKTIGIELEVQSLLEVERLPLRIEVFDSSHMMGTAAVGAMIVWNEGNWEKSSYRRYELSSKDEYGQMTEMLQRRISRFDDSPPPDLWVLDGGQANLNLAQNLLRTVGANLDVVAISKEKLDNKAHRAKGAARDIIYTQQKKLNLKTTDKRLQWLQKLRDEAHRFAIAYHQKQKLKEDKQVSLLNKKGVGQASIRKLINYFGTFENIEKANFKELASVTSKRIAEIILKED